MSIWLFVRLGGVALGIITLLGFASGYLSVGFKPYVKEVLNSLQYFADYIIQPELIERGLDWLREHFTWVPKPEAHWKPIYTLTALLLLSMARQTRSLFILIALVCALAPAIYAGTKPLDSIAVVMWPAAGIAAFLGLVILERNNLGAPMTLFAAAFTFASLGYFADINITLLEAKVTIGAIASVAIASLFTLGSILQFIYGDKLMALFNIILAAVFALAVCFENSGKLLLVVLAGFIGSLSVVALTRHIFSNEGTLLQRLQNSDAAPAIEVSGTLGSALFLGWYFAA